MIGGEDERWLHLFSIDVSCCWLVGPNLVIFCWRNDVFFAYFGLLVERKHASGCWVSELLVHLPNGFLMLHLKVVPAAFGWTHVGAAFGDLVS